MKYATERPYSDPEKAARRLMEHAHAFEPVQDGRIYIEKFNGPFLFGDKGTRPAEYSAGLEIAIARGWLDLHESGTYVKFAPAGVDIFASWLTTAGSENSRIRYRYRCLMVESSSPYETPPTTSPACRRRNPTCRNGKPRSRS